MKRVITAIALVAVALYLVWLAPYQLFQGAAAMFGLLCYWEYTGLVGAHDVPRPGLVAAIAGLALIYFPQAALMILTLLVIVELVAAMHSGGLNQAMPRAGCAVLGCIYAFAPWRFAVDLRHISVHLLFAALALNWVGDTVAFYTGRAFGRHKLAPVISPGKSWEGAIASVVSSGIFGFAYLSYFMPQLPGWEAAGIAALGNIAGQLGDLAESALKRGAGVKDSGNVLPGHGGMLDRLDSSLFSLPVVYALYLVGLACCR